MDALNGAGLGARRNEDIALDLFKYVASTAGVATLPRLPPGLSERPQQSLTSM